MVVSLPQESRLPRLTLTGLGRLGEALAEDDNGTQVFVLGGIPGETVMAEVIQERRRHITAKVVEVVEPSPHRVTAPCAYFGTCTGCQWQHIDYAHQLEMKRDIVRDSLSRVGGLGGVSVEPAMPSPSQLGYRNHARFTISKNAKLGFVNRATRDVVEVDECLLMAPGINDALASLQGLVGETSQLSIRYGINTGSLMVQPTLHHEGIPFATGQRTYEESLSGHTFQVASPSFFQVNTELAEQLTGLVKEGLQLTGNETVVDAYAGVSTFAVLLSDYAKRVIAIEESSSALVDAEVNTAATPNVELKRGRTEVALAEFVGQGIDAVVLDPPRAGCQPGALKALIDAAPRRIVYVSCDPETLARDLRVLSDGPFRIESVQPVDMFPQTHHVECVAVLSLDEERRQALTARRRLVLASSSPRRQDILQRMGAEFEVTLSEVMEPSGPMSSDDPVEMATGLALAKAQGVADVSNSGTIIGADTVVYFEGQALGKPRDEAEAIETLQRLRAGEHQVVTGVALVDAATGESIVGHRTSRIRMRDYTDDEIALYVASGDALDKAGAYAVQNEAFHPVEEVRGCYLNVVGLPVCTLLKLLERFGVDPTVTLANVHLQEAGRCQECTKRLHRLGA